MNRVGTWDNISDEEDVGEEAPVNKPTKAQISMAPTGVFMKSAKNLPVNNSNSTADTNEGLIHAPPVGAGGLNNNASRCWKSEGGNRKEYRPTSGVETSEFTRPSN